MNRLNFFLHQSTAANNAGRPEGKGNVLIRIDDTSVCLLMASSCKSKQDSWLLMTVSRNHQPL
jgi:hypothetical protein